MLDLRNDAETILDSIDGFLLVDDKERIVFMCKSLLDVIGLDSLEQVKGKRLRDVIAYNETHVVLETGRPRTGVTYFVHGGTIVSNGCPIYRDGALIGALEYDVFENADALRDLCASVSSKKAHGHFGGARSARKREKYSLDNIKGSGEAIRKLKNDIRLCAGSNSTVLISGETGTGKELIAHSIHLASQRRSFEFVEVNCATIPGDLFESELFGYEEGSFTGARKGGKAGLAELADKGTLFLDEINALPMHMQAKLLRFLQEKELRRVGGGLPMPVDARVIAATNEDPRNLVKKGLFRQDLYYRLNVMEIVAEPLRNRKGDIPELVRHFICNLNSAADRHPEHRPVRSVDDAAMKLLSSYDWPGNVRELQNVLERAMNRCFESVLTLEHFNDFPVRRSEGNATSPEENADLSNLREIKRDAEIRAILKLLRVQGLSRKDAAASLGISRQMLHRKIKEYGIGEKDDGEPRDAALQT
jgi:transcriptional regulator with PAS, ATPase and Fis domain